MLVENSVLIISKRCYDGRCSLDQENIFVGYSLLELPSRVETIQNLTRQLKMSTKTMGWCAPSDNEFLFGCRLVAIFPHWNGAVPRFGDPSAA